MTLTDRDPGAAAPPRARPGLRLQVDPIACRAYGLCAEELGELVSLDEWGYPIIAPGTVPPALERRARAAANACPVLALRLARSPDRG